MIKRNLIFISFSFINTIFVSLIIVLLYWLFGGFISELRIHNLFDFNITDIFRLMIIAYIICIIPQIIYECLLNKIFKINIGILFKNIISIIISTISSIFWLLITGISNLENLLKDLLFNYAFIYFPIIIGGILFINIGYTINVILNKIYKIRGYCT